MIVIIIIALPFLFYAYKLVPVAKVWETPFFKIESNYYDDVSILFWSLSNKLFTLLILFVWFLTCKHWWRFAILVPIIIEIYKFLIILNDELDYTDEYEFLYSLPITIPIIALILLLSRKLNYYNQAKNLNAELDEEIEQLLNELSNFKTQDYKLIRKELKVLRQSKNGLNKKDYLKQLIFLRNKLIQL